MRVSGTIPPALADWVREKIDDRTFHNESHLIEVAIEHYRTQLGSGTQKSEGEVEAMSDADGPESKEVSS